VRHAARSRSDLPDPARAHGRFPGRLAVVFHDRLFGRLLDDHRRRSRSLLRHLRGDRHHPMGEWIGRVSLGPVALDAASRRLRVETHRCCNIAGRVGIHAASVAVALRHRRRRQPPRHGCRLGRVPQLGHLPAVPLSSALWRQRPALRQGHRLLPLCAAHHCRPRCPKESWRPAPSLRLKTFARTGSTQRLERRLGDSEHDEECDRRRRDEIVRRCQVAAGHADQPSRDERREATEHRHRDVIAD
jgi:hypothetical protein